jgi:putative FmdB family regulatory protein
MPTYQYLCRDCGHGFEQFQKFSENALTDCPSCDGTVQRVIQNVGVVFKGSGWYITDSRSSSKKSDDPAKKTEKTESGDAKKTESKDTVGAAPAPTPAPST